MKRASLLLVGVLALVCVPRLPAPIVEEEKPTPASPSTVEKPKITATNRKSAESSESNSTRRFDGTWKGKFTENTSASAYTYSDTLTIKGTRTLDLARETTSTLASGKSWPPPFPQQYKHLSPLYFKIICHSDHLTAVGSDLVIRDLEVRLVDWEPKTLPREEAQKLVEAGTGKPSLLTLKGDELVGNKFGYHRVR